MRKTPKVRRLKNHLFIKDNQIFFYLFCAHDSRWFWKSQLLKFIQWEFQLNEEAYFSFSFAYLFLLKRFYCISFVVTLFRMYLYEQYWGFMYSFHEIHMIKTNILFYRFYFIIFFCFKEKLISKRTVWFIYSN